MVFAARVGEPWHIGSAHDDAELEVLKAMARQRLAAGQLKLDLGAAGPGPSGLTFITNPRQPLAGLVTQRTRYSSHASHRLPRMHRVRDVALLKDRRVIASAVIGLIAGFLIAALIFGKPWHLLPNWGDIPTWLAVVVATAGGWIALSQLRDQQEVLRQEAGDRRKAQAGRVFIGASRDPGDPVYPYVKNASDFAIYEAVFWYLQPKGLSRPDYLGTILPDEDPSGTESFSAEEARERTILTFRDANNVCWVRMPRGVLEEQSAPTARESVLAVLAKLSDLSPVNAAEGRDGAQRRWR